jgi:hypothetical protein
MGEIYRIESTTTDNHEQVLRRVPRMRTVNETVREFKQCDPHTSVTANFVRSLCKFDKVSHFESGTRLYLDIDDLINFLTKPKTAQQNGTALQSAVGI